MDTKTYNLELTEKELIIIHEVFDELTSKSLKQWTTYIDNGEFGTTECNRQWDITGKINSIREKAEALLK